MESPEPAAAPRQRDRAKTRAALLDAAAQVFAEKGLAAATLDAISERAGYTRGAFHHHFGSKEEIFLAVIARRDDELRAGYEPIGAQSMPPDAHANAMQWRDLHAADEDETLLRLELRLLALRDPEVRRKLVDVERDATIATAERLAETALTHGRTWRNSPDRVAVLVHLMSGALRTRAALGETDTVDLMEMFLRLVWDGSLRPVADHDINSSAT